MALVGDSIIFCVFFFNDTATTEIYTLSLHDALPVWAFRINAQAKCWRRRETVSALRYSWPKPEPTVTTPSAGSLRLVEESPELSMDKFVITGGTPLQGVIPTNGSKNSALPALAAALLTDEPVILKRIPRVRDIRTMQRLLVDIGAKVDVQGQTVTLTTEKIECPEAPYELVKTMRASSLVLGPLVARSGRARVSLPGGCAIGARPINLHIFGLEQLGARIHQSHGYIEAEAAEGLRGAMVNFERITVTGTEDLMMAAVLAKGETVLRNAALEPEVVDLAALLIKMGARIQGAGTTTIRIQGVERLGGAEHTIIPDRIEAGTFLVAGAITGGDLTLTRCEPVHVDALVSKLQQSGVE